MTKKRILIFSIFAVLITAAPVLLMAQDPEAVEVPIDFGAAEYIFAVGIGGLSVTALVEIIKRLLKAQGIAVIAISVVVSAAACLVWIFSPAGGGGFDLLKFLILTGLVASAANGIKLVPKTRTPQ